MKESDDALVLELINTAVRAGAYRARVEEYPARRRALEAMANRFSDRAATLSTEIAARAEPTVQGLAAMPTPRR